MTKLEAWLAIEKKCNERLEPVPNWAHDTAIKVIEKLKEALEEISDMGHSQYCNAKNFTTASIWDDSKCDCFKKDSREALAIDPEKL